MIKNVNRKFLLTVILFAVYFLGIGGLLFYGYAVTDGGNLVVTLTFVFFLATIFVTSYVSNRLNYLMNLSYTVRIQENSGQPLRISRVNDTKRLYAYLEENEFKMFKRDSSHYLFYRVVKDDIKKMFSMNMLEIVVYINKTESDFYLEQVNDEINDIKEMLMNKKTRVNRLFVSQIRQIDDLDQKTKDDISENVFIRTRHNIISTINIGVFNDELAVMLYSDEYTPSLYYRYHIDRIKDMI